MLLIILHGFHRKLLSNKERKNLSWCNKCETTHSSDDLSPYINGGHKLCPPWSVHTCAAGSECWAAGSWGGPAHPPCGPQTCGPTWACPAAGTSPQTAGPTEHTQAQPSNQIPSGFIVANGNFKIKTWFTGLLFDFVKSSVNRSEIFDQLQNIHCHWLPWVQPQDWIGHQKPGKNNSIWHSPFDNKILKWHIPYISDLTKSMIQWGPVIPWTVYSRDQLSCGCLTQMSLGFNPRSHVANNRGKTWEFKRIGAKSRSHIENESFKVPSPGIFWN